MAAQFREAVPLVHCDLLLGLIGQQVERLVRWSWWPPAKAAEELELKPSAVFSRTAGPLLVTFDSGTVVGFASSSELHSVTVWLESSAGTPVEQDEGLHPVDGCDPVYSDTSTCHVRGRRLASMTLLHQRSDSVLMQQRPCQAGLLLTFDGGSELLLSHGLHDGSDSFAVIGRDDIASRIAPYVRPLVLRPGMREEG
ncbi:hypothetical protein [Streptomyces sp. CLCI03]